MKTPVQIKLYVHIHKLLWGFLGSFWVFFFSFSFRGESYTSGVAVTILITITDINASAECRLLSIEFGALLATGSLKARSLSANNYQQTTFYPPLEERASLVA